MDGWSISRNAGVGDPNHLAEQMNEWPFRARAWDILNGGFWVLLSCPAVSEASAKAQTL